MTSKPKTQLKLVDDLTSQITFRGQRDGEKVIFLIHRHPWALVKSALIISFGVVLIVLMFSFFLSSPPTIWFSSIVGPILILYGLHSWYIWWNNIYLLTDQRVIVIKQRNLFSRRIEDYGLEKIQSVASDTQGLAATTLNFGTLMLAIMGLKDPVALPYIEDAYAVQEKVLSAIKRQEE